MQINWYLLLSSIFLQTEFQIIQKTTIMKKLMMMLLLVSSAIGIQAQESEKKSSLLDGLSFEIKTVYGLKQHNMNPLNLNMQLSYSYTDRLSLLISAERNYMLFNENDNKWYMNATSLGGGMAYVWMKDKHHNFDIRLQVLNTIGNSQWKHTAYDIGLNWYEKQEKRTCSPFMGIGFRYQKSHTSDMRDWCGFYATVGVRF